jgi:3',5'-cyclic AMP phosphodiesterase CpdA
MKEIIHLSDLHIGKSISDERNCKKIFGWISRNHKRQQVVITGDIVDSGLESEMRLAGAMLEKLSETNPVIAVPGNHDYAWKGNIFLRDSEKHWTKYIKKHASIWQTFEIYDKPQIVAHQIGNVLFVALDSGDPTNNSVCARGYISKKQIKRMKRIIRKNNEESIVIVLLHHHPFTDGVFTGLDGADMLMDSLRNKCDMLLFGHEHEYGIWRNEHDIPLIVSSHKTTEPISGDCLAYTVIDPSMNTVRLEVI